MYTRPDLSFEELFTRSPSNLTTPKAAECNKLEPISWTDSVDTQLPNESIEPTGARPIRQIAFRRNAFDERETARYALERNPAVKFSVEVLWIGRWNRKNFNW